nr:hypothetical protein [uncultured Pedobacter sp.]
MKQRHKSITIICPNCSLKQTAFMDMARPIDMQNMVCVNRKCQHKLDAWEVALYIDQTARDFITI